MSTLAILIPPRPRTPPREGEAAPAAAGELFEHAFSADGRSVATTGRAAASTLPRADRVVAVVPDADIAWHRITLPKAPPAKLRAALAGVLEDALLDDEETLHFALAPGAAPGASAWVAVLNRPWLASRLALLEAAGVEVSQVVPAAAPGDAAGGHFELEPGAAGPDAAPRLVLVGEGGVCGVSTRGSLARALLPSEPSTLRWTATPAAAAAAERWLGQPVAVQTEGERLLAATASPWNLRQFDLAPRHRGLRALREGWRLLATPAWRPVRWAALALVAVNLVGLNVAAWRERDALAAKRAQMGALLKAAHPGVQLVYDAPVQMQRENERLRASAGRAGGADLEVLLGAAAAAWPEGQGPVQTLRFETGRLTLAAPGWGEAQLAQFRGRLRPAGFEAVLDGGRVVVTRGNGGGAA